MTNPFTQSQVRILAASAGWTLDNAKIMAAICMVESAYSINGRAYADADKVGDQNLVTDVYGFSYGLAQIRSMYSQKDTGLSRDASRLPDPLFNLRSALVIWEKYRFQPWTTYNNGQYQAFLPDEYPAPAGFHVVISGDTLIKITSKYPTNNFTWQQLAGANGLVSPYTIFINQKLQLPVWFYTIRSGDTLSGIAASQTKVTVQELATFNNIVDANKIQANQIIKIPHPVMLP